MKATLAPGDLLIHVDFSESYKNQQQNEIQSAYFGNTTSSLFTACAYFRDSTNDHASHHCTAIVTESSEHGRVCALSCVTKVVQTIEVLNKKSFKNIKIWSDGCAAQFRSKFVFLLGGRDTSNQKYLVE